MIPERGMSFTLENSSFSFYSYISVPLATEHIRKLMEKKDVVSIEIRPVEKKIKVMRRVIE